MRTSRWRKTRRKWKDEDILNKGKKKKKNIYIYLLRPTFLFSGGVSRSNYRAPNGEFIST